MARGKQDGIERVPKNMSLPKPLAEWLRREAFERDTDQAVIVAEALEAARKKSTTRRNAA